MSKHLTRDELVILELHALAEVTEAQQVNASHWATTALSIADTLDRFLEHPHIEGPPCTSSLSQSSVSLPPTSSQEKITMTQTQLAKTKWNEAQAVRSAFAAQVSRRRAAWVRAAGEAAAARARAALKHAVEQLEAAQSAEDAAWKAWHALRAAA